MPDVGAHLVSFVIEHPDPAWVHDLYARLDVANPPKVVLGENLRYRALIKTPTGMKELR
jgi:hypothetical protein